MGQLVCIETVMTDDKGCIRKQEIFESGKLRGGKGGSDGGAIARRPHSTKKSAASLLAKPPFFISTFICYLSFGMWNLIYWLLPILFRFPLKIIINKK